MGSYYRVIIQDKHTEETLWASVDRVPFDVRKYLNRHLIYKVKKCSQPLQHCVGTNYLYRQDSTSGDLSSKYIAQG